MTMQLQSYIAGRWIGRDAAQTLRSAINGQPVARTHAEAIDFAEAVHHARTVGVANLLKLDFQQRAAILKALAKFLNERKEQLYAISAHTGATRADSWIDIEGGTGTLFAYASAGSNELPSGNVWHEGPAMPLGKQGAFAGTHVLVPRRGLAVHINAFNFPAWNLCEKAACALLAGVPVLAKPGTATAWLAEAVESVIQQTVVCQCFIIENGSGFLPDLSGNISIIHSDQGLSKARNAGIRASTTEFFFQIGRAHV